MPSSYPPQYGSVSGPYSPYIPTINNNCIIVVNSSPNNSGVGASNQSYLDALAYCSVRNIPTSNIRQFNFGSTDGGLSILGLNSTANNGYSYLGSTVSIQSQAAYNGVAAGSSILQVLANEIKNFGCLCVICSTYTPFFVSCAGSPNTGYTLPGFLSAAAFFYNNPMISTISGSYTPYSVARASNAFLSQAASLPLLSGNIMPANWASISVTGNLTNPAGVPVVAHGRLGCPNTYNALLGYSIAEVPLINSATSVFTNAYTNALISEQANNFNMPIHYSSVDQYSRQVANCGATYQAYLQQQAFTNVVDVGDSSQSSPPSLGYLFATTNPCTSPLPTMWAYMSNSSYQYNGPSIPADQADYNYLPVSTSPWKSNFQLLPGAFGTAGFSYPLSLGVSFLYNGASAFVMTAGEPYATNIPSPPEEFHLLANQKLPMCLAAYYSPNFYNSTLSNNFNICATACGDPLYQPFKSTKIYGPNGAGSKGLIAGLAIGIS